jgi:plastocyanin
MRNGPLPSSAGQGQRGPSARALVTAFRGRTATSQPSSSNPSGMLGRILLGVLAFASLIALYPSPASAQENGKVLIYSGTTGYRHEGGSQAIPPNGEATGAVAAIQEALTAAGYESDYRTCNGTGTEAGAEPGCRNPDVGNPAIFTEANLSQYSAILLFSASDYFSGTGGTPGQLWNEAEEGAIIDFVQNGGGIAALHNATDMGAGQTTWDWWDANNGNSAVGTTMAGHASNGETGTVMVQDQNHLSTAGLPDTFDVTDEHYNWDRNVRGDHHVLANFDERTYDPGPNGMGQDHPISWCRSYDGDDVDDGTGNPKPYDDGRVWISGIGHNAAVFTGNQNVLDHVVGGLRWASGEGKKSDCGGTVWSNYTRTVLVSNANNPIAIDVAADGKVYWTEIGPTQGFTSEGFVKMHDPEGAPNNQTTVATIPTRADHSNSEDGVLGMSLEPGFDLSDPAKRDIYVYYSPRNPAWPTTGDEYTVGHNLISRFTMTADGTAFEAGSEQPILEVPKLKLAGNPEWCEGCPDGNGPGHVGGAGLVFDSNGDLFLGVGDDVSPNEGGHGAYPPLDYRAQEHRDARKTSANTNDLRGKIVRIHPLDEIAAGAEPGMGTTYSIPTGNMFAPGTANTRPEIFAMGFRQPFTLHTDPANPGTVAVGEYCHDAGSDLPQRAPAGGCEWNLLSEPGFHGWPFCVADNSAANSSFKWDYAAGATTGTQYDCSLENLPSDLDYAPAGQSNPGPTFEGLPNIPGPAVPATIWKKTNNQQPVEDFGDLTAGGNQPITGPIYRYNAETAGPGAFPAYYDGSWLINNRGSDNGFWKEVRLREDNNEMLHVHDWLPYNAAGDTNADFNSLVIGTRFGPDGALYMGRFSVGCCRNQINASQQTQIVKIEFNVEDECLADEQAPLVSHELDGRTDPENPDTYVNGATLTLDADDVGCAGIDTVEYRVNSDAEEDWQAYEDPVPFEEAGTYSVDYRATDEFGNTSEIGTATFEVVLIEDPDAPVTTATLDPADPGPGGTYTGSVTVNLSATDGTDASASGVDFTEYRVNTDGGMGEWQTADNEGGDEPFLSSVSVSGNGSHVVEFRSTDLEGNVEVAKSVAFSIDRSSCLHSDEFDGDALDEARWPFVRGDAAFPPTVGEGALTLQILDEVDGTRTGPLSFVSQQVPEGDWSAMTRVTIEHESSWQQAGLMVWQSDTNFVKGVFSRNANSGDRYFELTSDNPPNNTRQVGPSTGVDATFPTTAWIRLYREGNTIGGEFAPDVSGQPGDWTPFASTRPVDVNPPREGEGVRVGVYAGSDIDGTFESTASFDFFRMEPDDCDGGEDTTPPTTTAQLNGAAPVPSYDGPVTATFTATDEDGGSGVESTEYRVDGGEWQTYNPLEPPVFNDAGDYALEFRSTDVAGNVEEPPGSVDFTITDGGGDATPPETTATLDPAAPGPGGTYEGPVDVTLSATDPDESGPEPQTHEVGAAGFAWDVTEVEATEGDTVEWDFGGALHDVCIDDSPPEWAAAVGDCGEDEVLGDARNGDTGGSKTFAEAGSFGYYCSIHEPSMRGTVNVAEGGGGGPGSGVDITEYRVNTNGATGEWVTSENTGAADPFVTSFEVSAVGSHVVEYRSTDVAGNVEETGSVAFSIDEYTEPGDPELDTRVSPRRENVKPGQQARFEFTASNEGDAAAEDVELCVKAPARKVKVIGRECRTTPTLAEGDSFDADFRLKPKRSAAGDRIEVRFVATAANADRATETATLKVKKKKRNRGR